MGSRRTEVSCHMKGQRPFGDTADYIGVGLGAVDQYEVRYRTSRCAVADQFLDASLPDIFDRMGCDSKGQPR